MEAGGDLIKGKFFFLKFYKSSLTMEDSIIRQSGEMEQLSVAVQLMKLILCGTLFN